VKQFNSKLSPRGISQNYLPGHPLGVILGSSIVASLGAIAVVQAAWAQSTAITNVEVISSGGGIQLVLETSGGEAPQVFTINRGNDVVADLVNTTLNLREGGSFRQNNPAPGIASIVVTPLDSNSVRVIVSGNGSAPNVDIAERSPSRITINYGTGIAGAPVNPPPPGNNPPPMAQEPPRPIAQQPQQPQSEPEVLVRNPEITINGVPVPSTGTSQAPPFLPRAVAPPVGDIAVSNTDSSPSLITLGSSEMIQSLVFKDTPVREALSVVARLAGVNVAYAAAGNTTNAQEVGELTINLDIENESLENVFNYILQLSGLEANRVGNTVFVGVNLPNAARDMVIRTIRVNQITARDAGFYLASLGAETAIQDTRDQTQTIAIPIPGTDQFRQETTTNRTAVIESLTVEESKYLNPILRGLQVVVDERANNLTLSGPRRLVEIASAQLVSLDIRKRQVAVNVKIIDVNLNNEDTFNTSFSFGINDSFFVSDNGAAAINFGGMNPPTRNTITNRLDGALNLVPPVVTNPFSGTAPFSDPTGQVRVPLTAPGQEGGSFLRPIAPLVNEVNGLFQPGISEYTPFTLDAGDTALESLELGEATFALPTLFEYPTKFLALLQAQVVSRNAKILTDPTVVIQEGQNASVSLTEEVIGNIERDTEFGDGFSRTTTTAEIKNAGLQLGITVDRIDDNGFVTMRILPNVRSIAGTQNFGDTEITLLAERSLDSGTIRLRDGQTLILSGIIQEQERTTVTKWPILGDLPIIGSLFRGSTSENQRAEVIVLVTPQVLDDSDRSGYGYGYVPGQDAQEMINRSR
jgi:type IV pilus assembly protein PilQ